MITAVIIGFVIGIVAGSFMVLIVGQERTTIETRKVYYMQKPLKSNYFFGWSAIFLWKIIHNEKQQH